MKQLPTFIVQFHPNKLMMKEKTCDGCGAVYSTMSYAEELKPQNLCSVCTVKYLYEHYRLNSDNPRAISIAPYYGIEIGKFRRAYQTYPKELVTA